MPRTTAEKMSELLADMTAIQSAQGNYGTRVQNLWIDVKEYAVTGNGTTDDSTTIGAVITAIGTYDATVNFSGETDEVTLGARTTSNTYKVGADITFPANITVRFDQGATMVISTGKTVTFNGVLDCVYKLSEVFTGAGSYVINKDSRIDVLEDSDVVGASSSTDNALVRFDLATGKLIQNSGIIADDSNNVTGIVNLTTTGWIKTDDEIYLKDSQSIYFGTNTDAEIYHDDSNLYIQTAKGSMYLRAKAGENGIVVIPDGAVALYYNNTKRLETTSIGVKVSSGRLEAPQINLYDDEYLEIGTDADLRIYHDGTINRMEIGKELVIRKDFYIDNDIMARFIPDGAVELYHDNVKKLETTAGGVTVTGDIGATNLSGTNTGDQNSTTIGINELGTATYDDVQDFITQTGSAGWISGGAFTDNTDGSMTVGVGTGLIRTTNSSNGALVSFDWAEDATVSLTDHVANYIAVDYNSGTPQIISTTTNTSNGNTIFNLGLTFREGTDLHFFKGGQVVNDLARKVISRFNAQDNITLTSGGAVAESGVRYLTVTAAVLYGGLTRFATDAIDTSGANTFEYYYTDGLGGFQYISETATQINNSQYDNAGTLTALTANRYRTDWLYLSDDGDLLVLMGTNNSTLATAQTVAHPTSLPPHIAYFSTLIAKVIVQASGTNLTEVDNLDTFTFSSTGTVVHNETTGLQGGTTAEYYHLTSADVSKLAAIEASADVTDAGNVGTAIHGATAKTAMVNADEIAIIDSAASNILGRITYSDFFKRQINPQTGTTYTFALTDQTKLVTLTNANPIALTVPINTSVAFPIGTQIEIVCGAAGDITVTPAADVTVNAANSYTKLTTLWKTATLIKMATDTWLAIGLEA